MNNPEVIQVIKTIIERGDGEVTPFREVVQLHDFDGNFIGENDPTICDVCKREGRIISGCTSSHK